MVQSNKARKELESTLRRAIVSTNAIGMPLLLIFVGAVLNITPTNIIDTLKLDWFFFVWHLGSIGGVAIFLVWLHFELVMRTAKPVADYLVSSEEPGGASRETAYEAIRSCMYTPFRAMSLSIIFYFLGVTILLAFIQLVYSFSYAQSVMLFAGAFSTGVLISFFQFFTSKRVLIGVLERILTDFPEFTRDESFNTEERSIREKLLIAIIILSVVLVTLTGVTSYGYAVQRFQSHVGLTYQSKIEDAESRITSLYALGDNAGLDTAFQQLHLFSGDEIILTDENGQRLEGAILPPDLASLPGKILNGVEIPSGIERNRPIITKINKNGIFCVMLNRVRITVVHHPLPGGRENIFVISLEQGYKRQLRILWIFILVAMGAAVILAFIYTYFAAEEMTMPLRNLVDTVRRVAKGDFSEPVRAISQDEIGVLALNQARMFNNLKTMIGRINEASSGVDGATRQISDRSGPMLEGSAEQVRNTEETAAAMEQMNQSIRMIAENIETLARSAEESSASILEMDATIDEVASNVERLSTAVEQTTSSIQEMTMSIKEVADNVQQLSRRSGESMLSLQEVENTIWSVGSISQDTARLSQQMAEDAEQGARSVAMTAQGIMKIRETSTEAAEVIDTLSQRARQIGNILDVINDVTEETNLLALNAAIIAAQAGEHGRGFAVVADEIKDLAERTQASTQEIAEIIQTVQEGAQNAVSSVFKGSRSVEEGVRLSEEARAALEQILQSAKQTTARTREIADSTAIQSEKAKKVMNFFEGVNDLIHQVANATQEQSRGGDLIFKAAQEMESISQMVKRATKEQSQGSKQITQAIENISQIVNYINTAHGEQIKSSQQVVQAMQGIRNVADGNASRVEEMSIAVENLKFLAKDLQELVQQFKIKEKVEGDVDIKEVFKL